MLENVFIKLCSGYDDNRKLIAQYWQEISEAYSGKKRHYHDLHHLSNMLAHLETCRNLVQDWDSIVFALFYHDFIYDPISKDNEEKSAAEAQKKLKAIHVPDEKIRHVNELILATKSHTTSNNTDINLFTDADLSILGTSATGYEQYAAGVRKEYSIYPDILYKPGRRKVLQYFLDMPYIFKTEFFRAKLESAARENIKSELKRL